MFSFLVGDATYFTIDSSKHANKHASKHVPKHDQEKIFDEILE